MEEINNNSLNEENEENINTNFNSSTLNQNFEDNIQKEKSSKKGQICKSTMPLPETDDYNIIPNKNHYNGLNDDIHKIINDTKNNNQKRSNSSYTHKILTEKYKITNFKLPIIENLNCDHTTKIIIHCLEQKIDVLIYENDLLRKKLNKYLSKKKDFKYDLTEQYNILKNEKYINEENLKILDEKKTISLKNGKIESIDDLYKEIKKIKDENIKLRKRTEVLSEDNLGLNKIIEELNNNKKLMKIKYNEEIQRYKNLLKNKNYKFNDINIENNNKKISDSDKKINEHKIINSDINEKYKVKNNIKINLNTKFDMDKYLSNREEYMGLLDENERLHQKLKNLLSVNDNEEFKISDSLLQNNNKIIYSETHHKTTNINSIKKNISINENNINDSMENNLNNNKINDFNSNINNIISYEELLKENQLLKAKIKQLNDEIDKINFEQNIKLAKIQEELKNYQLKEKNNNKNKIIKNNTDQELDILLNKALLKIISVEDEEVKKIINKIQNIKDIHKKRINQCLIINDKLKSLIEENYSLNNQLLSKQKGNNNFINNKASNTCLCDKKNNLTYDYLINLLKKKDDIIQKYKDKEGEEDIKNQELINENNNLVESYNNNIENGKNIINNMGLEDYLVDKIVNNQKEVLGDSSSMENNKN